MKPKTLNFRVISLVLITGLIFSSCKKEDTPIDDIIGTWTAGTPALTTMIGDKTLTQYFIDALGLTALEAQLFVAQFNQVIQQSFTGTIQIKPDGTYIANMGGSADSGTWSLSPDRKKLTIDSSNDVPMVFDVVELTSGILHLNISESSSEDLDSDGTPETITISIDVVFTR